MKIASRGDLLLAGPAFATLRRERPRARLVLLVGVSCEDVARRLPFFDEIWTIDDHALFAGSAYARARAATQLLQAMRGEGSAAVGRARLSFSEVFIFHRDWRYAFLAWLAGIPVRRGIVRGRSPFLTVPYAPTPREHDIVQYLRVVLGMPAAVTASSEPTVVAAPSLAGVWEFAPGERESVLAPMARHGFESGRPFVALGFGGGRNVKTRTSLKSWPLDSFRELAQRLSDSGSGVVWLGDAEDARTLGEASVGINLAGKLSISESAAVLSGCAAAVANDSLLLHLAEAVGTPTVGLFGPTDPANYGPLGPRSTGLWIGESLPCSPCYRDGRFPLCGFSQRCMRELHVATVLEKLQPLVASRELLDGNEVASHAG